MEQSGTLGSCAMPRRSGSSCWTQWRAPRGSRGCSAALGAEPLPSPPFAGPALAGECARRRPRPRGWPAAALRDAYTGDVRARRSRRAPLMPDAAFVHRPAPESTVGAPSECWCRTPGRRCTGPAMCCWPPPRPRWVSARPWYYATRRLLPSARWALCSARRQQGCPPEAASRATSPMLWRLWLPFAPMPPVRAT